ncbi:MAG: reductive dehalogenase domain-containing protein [Burkholderiaceae bacterium]
MERLKRQSAMPLLDAMPVMQALSFEASSPTCLAPAMGRFISMFDVVRDGPVAALSAEIPDDPLERSQHLKSAGYYFDAAMVGACEIPATAHLATPIRNPQVPVLANELENGQIKTFAAGMDMIFADVLESARTQHGPVDQHTHALVFLVDYTRDPRENEPGAEWILNTQAQRAALLAAQCSVVLSSYLRMLGYVARSHSASCSDVDLNRLAVASGLATNRAGQAINPFIGQRFGLAAVTTNLVIAPDLPLDETADHRAAQSATWQLGLGTGTSAMNRDPYRRRDYRMGAYPFEKLKRRDKPTTFIDHDRVPRFPKRADFFARVLCGDMGKSVQEQGRNAHYVMKSPIGACARRALGALLLLQFGEARGPVSESTHDPARNADNLKAASYYLTTDAVGLCEIPDWAYYSHDAGGNEMPAYHQHAVNMLLDQGHETMEGCSGDDWISVAQSMRAYLRFSMLGGVIGEQVRRLGYSARVHTVLDGDILQPPLLLLSGLGEVSRIGEVILNPYLGPRLKSGTVSTNMPMTFDKPIDFGLQNFCSNCNKCARECPSGAISAGPKLMYNGYEIWKSDAEKCARYRITNSGGGMCGRCMKTCPWNLEGLFAESGFRWLAMNVPSQARKLAALDDKLDRGVINPLKKWWWDIELDRNSGQYVKAKQTHTRGLNKTLKLQYEEQTLAVYPADKMPPPYPVAFPVDREEGISRYRALLTPAEYKRKLAAGETDGLAPPFKMPEGDPPVFPVVLHKREDLTSDIARYEFAAEDGGELPAFTAGAHIDVVIAPEYQRQYSLASDPAQKNRYGLGVLRESAGRGGSALMHRAFREGKRVFISKPINHFELNEQASRSFLFAGGIGVTPLLTMAHRLHTLGREFELHYSASSQQEAAFLPEILQASWSSRAHAYFSADGSRANLSGLIPAWQPGWHLYTCGSPRYMDAVFERAGSSGWPEESLHREFFAVPEAPDYVNEPFKIKLNKSQLTLDVPIDKSAADVMIEAGHPVEMKCSDGICGVCSAYYLPDASAPIEHRDFVLSKREREERIILCSSRCAEPGGTIVIDR